MVVIYVRIRYKGDWMVLTKCQLPKGSMLLFFLNTFKKYNGK